MTGRKALVLTLTLLIFCLALTPQASALTVKPEKPSEYRPREILGVSGVATPNTAVSIQLFDPEGRLVVTGQAFTDDEGYFEVENLYVFTVGDPEGNWKIKVYDPVTGEYAETTVKLTYEGADIEPPNLVIVLEPLKPKYGKELIIIRVLSDQPLKTRPLITVYQYNMPKPVRLEAYNETEDYTVWNTTYTPNPEYEGPAMIEVIAEDQAGNIGKAVLTFTVEVEPEWVKPVKKLEERVTRLENRTSAIENQLKSLTEQLQGLQATLNSQFAILTAKISDLGERLQANQQMTYIAVGVGAAALALVVFLIVRLRKATVTEIPTEETAPTPET